MNTATSRTVLLTVAFATVAAVTQAQSVTKVTDFTDVLGYGSSDSACAVGDHYFFCIRDSQNIIGLWKTDGKIGGETMATTFTAYCKDLTNVNGILCFIGVDGSHGEEIWQSDGTTSGTFMVADIRTGPAGSTPAKLRNVDGTLFFTADDYAGGQPNRQVWRYTPAPPPPAPDPADLNHDGKVDAADVVTLVNRVTSETATATPPIPKSP